MSLYALIHLEKGLKNRLNRILFHFGLLAEELSGGKTFDETIFRKKLIEKSKKYDVCITSYSLLQKDIDSYQSIHFSYMILDEAQHIKNRGTRNAKSVKRIKQASLEDLAAKIGMAKARKIYENFH